MGPDFTYFMFSKVKAKVKKKNESLQKAHLLALSIAATCSGVLSRNKRCKISLCSTGN